MGKVRDCMKRNRKKLGEKRDERPILFDPPIPKTLFVCLFCHWHIKLGKFDINVSPGSFESQKSRIPSAPFSHVTDVSWQWAVVSTFRWDWCCVVFYLAH